MQDAKDKGKPPRARGGDPALGFLLGDYDFIVIDTAPALSAGTINAFVAGDCIVVPVQGELFSHEGLRQLGNIIRKSREVFGTGIEIDGLLLVRYRGLSLEKQMHGMFKASAEALGTSLYNTVISDRAAVKEAQINKKSIYGYAPKNQAAVDYSSFVSEFLQRRGKNG
jgi:chromosome partitioning protein